MVTLLRPPRLQPGDRVAVLTPASPCPSQEIEAGCSVLETLGLQVTANAGGEGSFPRYLAGSDDCRAARFNESLKDPALKALLCARGGYGSLRILPRLSYAELHHSPKAIVGFSDLTALLFACHLKANVVCFHGPTVSTLASAAPETVQSFWTALSSNKPMSFKFPTAVCLRPGTAVGSVLGGNLTTLCHLIGTGFLPPLSERILFLEDRGEPLYRLDRMFTQLIHSGSLAGVAALMLGDFTDCSSREELNELVLERLIATSFPIISGIPVGHGTENLTLPLGLTATLEAKAGILTYHQTATSP
jgi:muramoyltetrapeptide carboxypeptidase